MYFSSVRGVREEHSSGSGLSESRCSFLFRALMSPTEEEQQEEEQDGQEEEEEGDERGGGGERGRQRRR